MTNDQGLDSLFGSSSRGSQRMMALLQDPEVSQITCDKYNRVVYIGKGGPNNAQNIFPTSGDYIKYLNELLALTDAGYTDVLSANTSVIEGSFDPERIAVHGSIHICTREITRGEPSLTIRKQPVSIVTLDKMVEQRMLSPHMRLFLEQAIRGRSNILISGGSGAGKTTLARALSSFIDPTQRVITCEEIDELHIYDRHTNCVSLTTYRKRDHEGRLIRETSLDDLVREGLRMRGDRVWVGETRGKEAYALVKACNSGHDGSVTTIHADNGRQATKQATTYVMESGLSEGPARDQVAQAFDLVIQINKVRLDRRVISEISQLESVVEGNNNQRLNQLFRYNSQEDNFEKIMDPTPQFLEKWMRYGVNPDMGYPLSRR